VAFEAKVVQTADGGRLPYDYLVIATGSATNFFGMISVERAAHGLKDLPEAVALRTHVIRAFEGATRVTDQAALGAWLTFVVVGGGPTGVEYAGALSELIHRVLVRDYPELDLRAVRVILLEALDRLLPAFLPALSENARKQLERLGVEVRLGARLLDATDGRITLSCGETLTAQTLVWAAGVKPGELDTALDVRRTRSQRIAVDPCLRIPDCPGAFAIGDVAGVTQDGGELAMMSPQAMQEGRYVADAIVRLERKQSLQPFRYRDKGIMATIGRHSAVAQVGPLSFTGPIGWFVWLFVHLYFIIGYRNRLVVLISWAWNYVFYDRPIRLITRERDGTEGE
jgi:NADH dehydrogenase